MLTFNCKTSYGLKVKVHPCLHDFKVLHTHDPSNYNSVTSPGYFQDTRFTVLSMAEALHDLSNYNSVNCLSQLVQDTFRILHLLYFPLPLLSTSFQFSLHSFIPSPTYTSSLSSLSSVFPPPPVLFNFAGQGEQQLPLEVGDMVCIMEENREWYRGHPLHLPSKMVN